MIYPGNSAEKKSGLRDLLMLLERETIETEGTCAHGEENQVYSRLDERMLSDEALDELTEEGGPLDYASRVKLLLQELSVHKRESRISSHEEAHPSESEEVSVDWQPLVNENTVIEAGEAWGTIQVRREKKLFSAVEDISTAQDKGSTPSAGGGDSVLCPAANCPAGEQLASRGDRRLPTGSGGALSWKLGSDGKPYTEDSLTGERMEIPDHGEIKASHRMILKHYGKTGEIQRGDMLAWYENT